MSEELSPVNETPKRRRGFTLFVKDLFVGGSPRPLPILPGEDRHYVRRKLMDTAKRHGIKIKAPTVRVHGVYQLWITRIS